jgi:hypothetical protein
VDPFPDYADTILKLTRKANQKLRKSRKKAVADADDDMGKKKRKKKGLGEQQLAVFGAWQAQASHSPRWMDTGLSVTPYDCPIDFFPSFLSSPRRGSGAVHARGAVCGAGECESPAAAQVLQP